MEIFAISGSIRDDSYNFALLKAMAALSPENMNINVFDNIHNIPIFNPEIDDENLPEPVVDLIAKLRASDGVIISTPEYAHGVPGALKNMLDWLVSSDVLTLKPIVVTSVSTSGLGGVRAYSPLVLILSAMNTHVVIEGSLNIPYAKNKFDENNNLQDELTKKAITVSLLVLEQAIYNA